MNKNIIGFNRWQHVWACCMVLMLQACGGDGSGQTASTMPPDTFVQPTQTASPIGSPLPSPSPTSPGSTSSPEPSPTPTVELPPLSGLPGLTALPQQTLAFGPATPLDTSKLSPTVTAVADGDWSNASTWNTARVPADSDIVAIPAARRVELRAVTAKLGGLWIQGRLTLADQGGTLLNTRFAAIAGVLQAGSEAQPIVNSVGIELWGTNVSEDVMGMGTKGLMVMSGGLLKLHGAPRLSWTKLDASAAAGSSRITLKDDTGSWRAGDKVVIASGTLDPRDSQVLTLTKVNGKQIEFTPALAKPRYGVLQTYEGKVLDQRPSVSLLTRNLFVRGASDSDVNAFGGHIMVMAGGHGQISGIELTRMGQRGLAGRYPLHWHEAKDRDGSYAIGNSINGSFQRAVVLHSTNKIQVDGNVAYDVSNHAYVWAEDGDEVGNTMTRNVGVLVRSPEERHFAFPLNNPFFLNSSQGEARSAVFWGRSMSQHVLRDNISAGALDGFGYFVDLFTPAPDSTLDGSGMVFDGNVAHSTYLTFVSGNQINYPEATRGHGLMITTGAEDRAQYVFQRFTGYNNMSGAWLEDRASVLKDSIVADNAVGVIVLRGVVDGVTIVGRSENSYVFPRTVLSVANDAQAGIQIASSDHGGKRAPLIKNVTVINQPDTAILWDGDNVAPGASFGQVRLVNTPRLLLASEPAKLRGLTEFFDRPNYGFEDEKGLVLGNGVRAHVMQADTNYMDPTCTTVTSIYAVVCPTERSIWVSANQDLSFYESSGQLSFLRYWEMRDPSYEEVGHAGLLGAGRRYESTGVAGTRLALQFSDALGKSVELALPSNAVPTRAIQGSLSITQAGALSELRGASVSSWFYDATGKKLYFRFVGSAVREQVVIEAPFIASIPSGRLAEATNSNAAVGFNYQVHANTADYRFRYPIPAESPVRRGTLSAATINNPPFLNSAASGDTTVIRGYVFAPEDGIYRIGLWGGGGGTSIWVGNEWVMGEPWAFINSNNLRNDQLVTEFQARQPYRPFALRAGWHAVTVVHAKMPANTEGNYMHLRWTTPSNDSTWVYPQWKAGL
jgi:hypothetical protein